jgi:hypothetical protein
MPPLELFLRALYGRPVAVSHFLVAEQLAAVRQAGVMSRNNEGQRLTKPPTFSGAWSALAVE